MANQSKKNQTKQIVVKFSLVGMILNCVIAGLFIVMAICMLALGKSFIDVDLGMTGNVVMIYGIAYLIVGLIAPIPVIIIYMLFKKSVNDKEQHIALCVCAIIFGGIFNIVAAIIFLVNNNSK
ncbi:MAG: hypothetical protein LBS95_01825 [Mycoplasmataceae bacterium]|jgi:RsiW-degrading membrane proteinase PrsW (M82 family)|nr:hypothetical protein [Mycoplasmataceae bacterium]